MEDRVRVLNEAAPNPAAKYVLYRCVANRRVDSNHALLYAAGLAHLWNLPVLFFEELDSTAPYANDRMHTFVLEGVPETARRLEQAGAGYVFHLRRRRTDPADVFFRLAAEAAAVVTDDHPLANLPADVPVAYHAVDSSCVAPMSRIEKRCYAAYSIRPRIHRLLPRYLKPEPEFRVGRRFDLPVAPAHTPVAEAGIPRLVAGCEIDHSVPPSVCHRGGRLAAEARLAHFLKHNLRRYARHRNEPTAHATSGLSPYLHFGHISSLEVALAVREHAERHKLIAGEFLEKLIVRRELAFNFARFVERPDTLECLPDWARKTLAKHDSDPRPALYSPEQFERAETHDALWNAAQKEMLLRGTIHGYYRMYWGKKLIEWSPTHQAALETMIRIHDRWAVDGRDPNTYTNILWCFGLHDRPWRERPIFGTVRYMSLDGMKRKTNVEGYLREMAELEK